MSENSRSNLQEALHVLTELNEPERMSVPEWLRVEGSQQTLKRTPVCWHWTKAVGKTLATVPAQESWAWSLLQVPLCLMLQPPPLCLFVCLYFKDMLEHSFEEVIDGK